MIRWRRVLGEGYSSFAVTGDVAVTLFRDGEQEVAIALDAESGEQLWRYGWPEPAARFNDRFGLGPYSTPTIHGNRVAVVGSGAKIRVFDLRTGALQWQRDLWQELGGPEKPGPGYTASPLIIGAHSEPRILLPLGHSADRGVVALDLRDGALVWSSGEDPSAHSSPILGELGGREQVIVVSTSEISGLDPLTGQALWRYADANPNGANILTPLIAEDRLFVSSGPAKGSQVLEWRPSAEGAEKRGSLDIVWSSSKLRVFYSNAVKVGARLIGSNGGVGPAMLTAVDFKNGEIAWRSREIGRANLVVAGDKILALGEEGTLHLLLPGAEGIAILATTQLFEDRSWTPPAIVGHRLFARDRQEAMMLVLP